MADFDWKGKSGDNFAESKSCTAEDTDKDSLFFLQQTTTQVFFKVVEILKFHGFPDLCTAKVLDIGCSTGGKLAVLEAIGFQACNLFGIDVSPKAIEIAAKAHPAYNFKEIDGFSYDAFGGAVNFDLVYHSAVFCQVPEESYASFFNGIRTARPKFYMFLEGICPHGPVKVPNAVVHDLWHQQTHISHRPSHHHHHEKPDTNQDDNHHFMMDSGFHYVDNLEDVVAKFYPEAKQIARIPLDFNAELKNIFQALNMEYFLVSLYVVGLQQRELLQAL